MSANTLFVFGSMSEGMVHYGRISSFVQNKQEAAAQGSLYRLEVGYPVFIPEGETPVKGQLLQLEVTDIFWKVMDEFHGYSAQMPEKSLYLRLPISVNVDGVAVETQVYSMNPAKLPRTATLIEGGDWQASIKEKEPFITQLSSNQKCYVQKLGKSTGRDIVPINLDLYRELMNKGLIIDKGRRLALTPLGHEVFRFLE